MNVFYINTPLHLLFALHILDSEPEKHPALLLMVVDYQNAAEVIARIQSILPQHQQVVALPGRVTFWGKVAAAIHAQSRWRYALAKLVYLFPQIEAMYKARHILKHRVVDRFFVFDDSRPDAQGVMNAVAQDNGRAKFVYIEDGLSAYYEQEQVPELKQQMQFILSRIFGKHFEITPYHGAHSLITEGIVLQPNLANSGLKQKTLTPMPPFALDDAKIELLIEAFSSARYDWQQFQRVILICAPLSIAASPQFIADVQQLTQAALEQGQTVIYKFHPREAQANYLGSPLDERPVLIDRTIPAELICARLGRQLEQIYTQFGSILLTAKWVNPAIERYMILSGAASSIRYSETVYNLLVADGVQVVR